jgi:hypothetical protein
MVWRRNGNRRYLVTCTGPSLREYRHSDLRRLQTTASAVTVHVARSKGHVCCDGKTTIDPEKTSARSATTPA